MRLIALPPLRPIFDVGRLSDVAVRHAARQP